MNNFWKFSGASEFFSVCQNLVGKRVGILGHYHPDADCLGAQVAMSKILEYFGAVPVFVVELASVPQNLRWMLSGVETTEPTELLADELVFVDCSDKLRAGDFVKNFPKKPILSVDHHISGEPFAEHNFFFPEAAATCEIIAEFLYQESFPVSAHMANALYAGIVTDTGKFSYSSTSATTLKLASNLIEDGAAPHDIFIKIYQNESKEKMDLLQRLLASLRFYLDQRVCIAYLSEKDYLETKTTQQDNEGMVNYPRSISGVEIAVLVSENEGKLRVSMRCDDPDLRLDKLAMKLNGGGHACAAAFTVKGTYEKFEKVFINALQQHLNSFSVVQ